MLGSDSFSILDIVRANFINGGLDGALAENQSLMNLDVAPLLRNVFRLSMNVSGSLFLAAILAGCTVDSKQESTKTQKDSAVFLLGGSGEPLTLVSAPEKGAEGSPKTPRTAIAERQPEVNARVQSSPPEQKQNAEAGRREGAALIRDALAKEKNGSDSKVTALIAQIQALPKSPLGDVEKATASNKEGLRNLNQKQYELAAACFKLASEEDPSDAKYLNNLGSAELVAGQLDKAQTDLIASLTIAPDREAAWVDLGKVFAKKGDQQNAVSSFLVGHKVSTGKSIVFLQSLKTSDDPALVKAAAAALAKLSRPVEQAPGNRRAAE